MAIDFPSSPTVGQTFTPAFGPTYSYDGSKWRVLTPGNQFSRTVFTATTGQTTFSVFYTIGAIDVFKNGLKLLFGIDFNATNGTTVVLTSGATVGDKLEVVSYSQVVYTAVRLTSDVIGTLPVANGGTGVTTSTGTGSVVLGTTPTFTTSALFPAGAVGAPGISVSGDTNTGIYFPAADTIGFVEGGVEAMRLDSSGNVGIGTTSPSARLHSSTSSAANNFRFDGNNFAGGNYFGSSVNTSGVFTGLDSAGGFVTNVRDAGYLAFSTNNTERMRLDASGNLGIGTTSPASYGKMAVLNANSEGFIVTGDSIGRDFAAGKSSLATVIGYAGSAGMVQASTFGLSSTPDLSLQPYGGNVGIGTTSPANFGGVNLQVQNGNIGSILWSNGTHVGQLLASAAAEVSIGSRSNSPLRFGTNDTERARIDSSGNLLVGTTSASASSGQGVKLLPGGVVYAVAPTSSGDQYNYFNTTASAYRFYVTSGGTINATSTTITAISDRRLKENIVDLDVGLDALLSLKPRKFDWKSGKGKDIKGDRGWIADEFQQVFPDLIDTWKDTPPEGEEPYKAVRPDLMPVVVRAIQELAAKVSALEAKQ